MSNGQRVILKNNKWLLLCQYNQTCRNLVKEDFLCLKHYELLGDTQRNTSTKHLKSSLRIFSLFFCLFCVL